MQCEFCEYWKEEAEEMETEDILKLLDEARSFGIRYYNAWTVEPLLRDELPQIMAHAHSLGMITSMITNGKLLKQRVHDLDDVDYLSVSVDGIDAYRQIRGMDPEVVFEGIRAAKNVCTNPILMNCVISGQNLDDIDPLIHKAQELGVWMSFEPLNELEGIDSEIWNRIKVKDIKKYESIINLIITRKKTGYPIINSLTYLRMVRDRNMDFRCRASDIILNVTPNGNIENCRIKTEILGHISDGLENVWNRSVEKRKKITQECNGCLFFGYVEGSLLYDLKPEVMAHYEWI